MATKWCDGYGLAGPALVSIGRVMDTTRPCLTNPAAALRTSAVTRFRVPSSSSAPQRPQLQKRFRYSS